MIKKTPSDWLFEGVFGVFLKQKYYAAFSGGRLSGRSPWIPLLA